MSWCCSGLPSLDGVAVANEALDCNTVEKCHRHTSGFDHDLGRVLVALPNWLVTTSEYKPASAN